MEASDIVLMKDDLFDVVVALDLSKVAFRRVKINFFWAFIYNIILMPIAAGVLYPWTGFKLNPLLAAIAMASSSICVITSALLLNRYKKPSYN